MTRPTSHPIPAPDRTARDAFGRLVAASWGLAPVERSGGWLVAVDGSPGSCQAAAMVARLITPGEQAEVDLVHVHPWLVKEAAESELAPRGWHAASTARALMDEAGVAWRLHVRMGEAAAGIVALAQELGSAGIALGSRGLTAAESVLLGSVAHTVVHLSRLPVLIAR